MKTKEQAFVEEWLGSLDFRQLFEDYLWDRSLDGLFVTPAFRAFQEIPKERSLVKCIEA